MIKTRSESWRRNPLRATFHCLSLSYSLSKCKCNKWVLHLSNPAMHVDTCLPQPFLHCRLPIAVFAEITSAVSSLFECSSHPFTSVTRTFICASHYCSKHCCLTIHSTALGMCLTWLQYVSVLHHQNRRWSSTASPCPVTRTLMFLPIPSLHSNITLQTVQAVNLSHAYLHPFCHMISFSLFFFSPHSWIKPG